jgi:hypothetical protein
MCGSVERGTKDLPHSQGEEKEKGLTHLSHAGIDLEEVVTVAAGGHDILRRSTRDAQGVRT